MRIELSRIFKFVHLLLLLLLLLLQFHLILPQSLLHLLLSHVNKCKF